MELQNEEIDKEQVESSVSENAFRRQVRQGITCLYHVVRIFTIVAFLFWILVAIVFKSGSSNVICYIFLTLLLLSAIIGRAIAFWYKQMSRLGFLTEIAFIAGGVFLLLSFVFEGSIVFVGFPIFSFVVSPVLAILRRLFLILRKEAKSVASLVAEIIILSIPAIVVTWVLVKYGLR